MTTTSTAAAPLVLNTPVIEAARQELANARRSFQTAVAAPFAPTARGRIRQMDKLDELEAYRDACRADVERAIRAANPGQPEAAIQAAVRAL